MSDSDSSAGNAKTTKKGDAKQEAQESKLFVSPIAEPLASDKLSKKLIKLVKDWKRLRSDNATFMVSVCE